MAFDLVQIQELKAQGAVSVKDFAVQGNGTTDDSKAILDAAQVIVATGGGTLAFPKGSYRFALDVTIPSGLTLQFADGAVLEPDSGVTLTINSGIQAGLHQIFGGSGTIAGSLVAPRVFPQWFGSGVANSTSPVQQAINAGRDYGIRDTVHVGTGSMSAGSRSLYLGVVGDWEDGDGIVVEGAGSVSTLTTPNAPSVTPSSGSGAYTWGYKIVALTGNGGGSASSAQGTTSTSTSQSLSSSATNSVSWDAVSGAEAYAVYRTEVPSGSNQGTGFLCVTDQTEILGGDTGLTTRTPPEGMPSTAPSSAFSDHLFATVSSGTGTTTLILNSSANTGVSGAAVKHNFIQNLVTALDDAVSLNVRKVVLPLARIWLWDSSANLQIPDFVTLSGFTEGPFDGATDPYDNLVATTLLICGRKGPATFAPAKSATIENILVWYPNQASPTDSIPDFYPWFIQASSTGVKTRKITAGNAYKGVSIEVGRTFLSNANLGTFYQAYQVDHAEDTTYISDITVEPYWDIFSGLNWQQNIDTWVGNNGIVFQFMRADLVLGVNLFAVYHGTVLSFVDSSDTSLTNRTSRGRLENFFCDTCTQPLYAKSTNSLGWQIGGGAGNWGPTPWTGVTGKTAFHIASGGTSKPILFWNAGVTWDKSGTSTGIDSPNIGRLTFRNMNSVNGLAQGWSASTPPLPSGTGSGNAFVNTTYFSRLYIYMTGQSGTHVISTAGIDTALPSEPSFIILNPNEQVYFETTVPSSWVFYADSL